MTESDYDELARYMRSVRTLTAEDVDHRTREHSRDDLRPSERKAYV